LNKWESHGDKIEFCHDSPEVTINGKLCRIKIDDDGYWHLRGPEAVWQQMRELEAAQNWLVTVSHIIGVNVNTVTPEALDEMLGVHHKELLKFVPDGSYFDMNADQEAEFIERGNEFVSAQESTLKDPVKRSLIIRKHMIAAKREERAVRAVRRLQGQLAARH
jgi:hypothetical protein